jgi:hypothetical protein
VRLPSPEIAISNYMSMNLVMIAFDAARQAETRSSFILFFSAAIHARLLVYRTIQVVGLSSWAMIRQLLPTPVRLNHCSMEFR